MNSLNVALKEWDMVISALLAGRQVVLLRKGGILEAENEFQLERPRFLFYPTFIHQDPKMVRPEFRPNITQVREEPDTIELRGYGEVARIFEVPSRPKLEALSDLHPWDAPLLDMRFAYRPEKPLYLVVLRALRLPSPVRIKNTMAYAGCKSWVPLEQEIDITNSTPALPESNLQSVLTRIESTFK